MTTARNKIRRILSDYNADRKDLFSVNCGLEYVKQVPLSEADRFVLNQLWVEYQHHDRQVGEIGNHLKKFIKKAPKREAEARVVLKTIPGVGPVTTEVVISELGEIGRFKNAKAVSAYAGLVPVVRQTGGKKSKDLGITKRGRHCCGGRWWKRAGVWSGPAKSGNGFLSESANVAEASARLWRWRGNCCA